MSNSDPSEAVERKQSVAGIFHRASSIYDRVGPGFFAYFGRGLVKRAALPLHAHVLDVACGRGAILFPAAEAVGSNGLVTGIDLAEGMVQETTREAMQHGLANVEIRQMDAEHLDFPDTSFDVILCGFALFFFPQLDRALAEFHRVLKPGGRITVSTWGKQPDKEWKWFDNLIDKYLPPTPPQAQVPDSPIKTDFRTPAGMEKIFQEAGFIDIHIDIENADFIYATREEWWQTLWSHGGRDPLEQIEKNGGAETLARFKAECLQQLEIEKGSRDIHDSFQVLYTSSMKPT